MKINKRLQFNKGSGEFVAFSVVAPLILSIVIMMCAYIQLTVAIREITNALSVSGRSAAVCTSFEDAEAQSLLVAQSAITDRNISNISIKIEYASGYTEWERGSIILVTIYADVDTVAPFLTSGTRSRTMVVTVEGRN